MESIEQDPRFAHVASDPRFKPMPKSKKKVKIDSRFQSLFTNKHFSHRTDMDKRGRPALNRSQKNKSTMEQFYEMSSESSSEETSSESESSDEEKEINDISKNDEPDSEEEANKDSLSKLVKEKKKRNNIKKSKSSSRDLGVDSVDDVSKSDGSLLSEKKTKKRKRKTEETTSNEENVKKKKSQLKNTDLHENSDAESSAESDESNSEDGESLVQPLQQTEVDDDDTDDSDEEEDLPMYSAEYDMEETDHQWNELEKDAPLSDDASHRFAVCNMDWDFVKAQDLFVLFKSFVPEGGSVKSVAIYTSEYGKERMAEEVKLGPKEIREHTQKVQEDKATKKKGGKKMDEKKEKDLRKTKEEIQTEKLREYQLNRLKYYYAVVDCDSVKTADTIYAECDGREYQLSSVRLDLRFIPDDMTFDDDPREVFSEQQTVVDYQPSSFESSALCNAKVEVTWDETEFDRLSRRVGVMHQKDLENIIEENKYADIIAPPDSESEEEEGRPDWLVEALAQESEEDDEEEGLSVNGKKKTVTEEQKIKLYRKLLIDKANEDEKAEKDDKDVDKVIEWTPGVNKSDVKKKLKKKEKNDEETAVVNDYLEKRREKKKKKRNLKKQKDLVEEGDALEDDDDDLMDVDDSIKKMMVGEEVFEGLMTDKKKKKKNKKTDKNENDEDDDKERAELELMLMDDNDTKKYSKPVIVDDNESKSKKKRKSKKAMAKQKMSNKEKVVEKEDYVMDVDDTRFNALYSSHHFHIDPTAPQFKKTKNMMRLVDEQIKRKKSGKKGKTAVNSKTKEGEKSSKSVSQSLVESLKKKMKKS